MIHFFNSYLVMLWSNSISCFQMNLLLVSMIYCHLQCSNDKWLKHRLYRLTVANFYLAAVNRVESSSKLNSMIHSKFSSPSVEHGKYYEAHVRNLYLKSMIKKGVQDISVENAGLIISNKHSFLGASLEGIVQNDRETWGLEIKCQYSKYNSSLSSALNGKKFFLKKNKTAELQRNTNIIIKYMVRCTTQV